MSAKFVYNLSEDNRDLQKQIGCMNGIFQLFDRHQFLGGGRRYIGQRHKSLPSGQNGNHGMEPKHASRNTTEKDNKTTSREKHRTSTESSRTSFSSSSCSSSLSSLESAKAIQREPSSFSQTVTQESRQRDSPVYCSNVAPLPTWQSPDLRHAVMNSLFRERRGISVKTAAKGEAGGQILKYIDSPRPLQCPKSVEPNYSGLRESIGVFQKSQPPPRKSSERAESSFSSSLKDVRRLSLDGRESRDNFKSTMKPKELPRLSLDSQAGSTRRYKDEGATSHPLQDTKSGNFDDFVSRQGPGTSKQSSSVVAKLMGLEALTESPSNDGNQAGWFKGYYDMESDAMQSSKKTNQKVSSPRCLSKEPSSPRPKSTDSVKKNASKTKSSTESAPWSHSLGKIKSSPSAPLSEATIRKDQSSSVSVFGEMEKRLAQLEFKKSGKDLRALKQILEAMQKTGETFENRSDASEFVSHTSRNKSPDLSSDLANLRTPPSCTPRSFSMKEYSSSESFKSPIVIMKPAKLTRKVKPASQISQSDDLALGQLQTADSEADRHKSNDKQTARDLTRKTNDLRMSTRHPPLTQDKSPRATPARLTSTPNELQSTIRERTDSTENLRTTNSRHQQKRPELEKHSQNLTPSVDLNRVTRQTCRQFKQPGSHQRQPKSKPSNLQVMEKEPSNTNGVRDSTNLVDAVFQQSESNVGKASLVDAADIITDRSEKIQPTHLRQKVTRSIKDTPTADPIVSPSEQPSPVSVLDATFYDDELPSPIKKISTSIKDDEMFSDELDWNSIAANYSSSSINSSSVIDSNEVENINCLNQRLEQMLSANESITNELEDFNLNYTATTLNSTAHSLKSDLFLAMQQAKGSKERSGQGSDETISQQKLAKMQRKLLFDVLNEVLCQKLLLESSSKMWHAPIALAHKVPRGLKLWEELCAEVERLKSTYSTCSLDTDDDSLTGILLEDLMQQTLHWRSDSEIPLLVLDIERLIFKDIINEVVIGEATSLQRQSTRHYKQLFSM